MTFGEMVAAMEEAQRSLRVADENCGKMANLLVGRLRKCGDDWQSRQTLAALKRELRSFDITRKTWKPIL